MTEAEERMINILDEIYDIKKINKPFTAISLIGKIDCIKDRAESTQHSDILFALHHGIDCWTVAKRNNKFVLINIKQ